MCCLLTENCDAVPCHSKSIWHDPKALFHCCVMHNSMKATHLGKLLGRNHDVHLCSQVPFLGQSSGSQVGNHQVGYLFRVGCIGWLRFAEIFEVEGLSFGAWYGVHIGSHPINYRLHKPLFAVGHILAVS